MKKISGMSIGSGISEMRMADFPSVDALWRAAGMWPHPGEGRAWLKAALARNPGLFLVYKDGSRVIGTALGAWDGLRGWVYHLAVREDHRGRGIGSLLLKEAERRLKKAGIVQVNLMVYEKNRRGPGFYCRRGYERSPVKVFRKRFGQHPGRSC